MRTAQAHLSAIRCAEYAPDAIWDAIRRAVEELGGFRSVIPSGSTVLLKPNLVCPRSPAEAVTTHPSVVQAVANLVRIAGASRVWIADSCAGDHSERQLYEQTGMVDVARAEGAELKSYSGVPEPCPVGMIRVPIPSWLADVDIVVSLPKLKTHALTGLTCAMKNVFGLVAGNAKSAYHGHHPSPRTMGRFLVEVYLALKPHLSIVDAVEAMEGEGPASGVPKHIGLILAARDAVAIDAVCAGMLPGGRRIVPMLLYADEMQAGVTDLAKITVTGDGQALLAKAKLKPSKGMLLLRVPEWLFKPASKLLAARPRISNARCIKCGICASICSQNAIERRDNGAYEVNDARCIMCMCCAESCPHHAILLRSPFGLFARLRRLLTGRSGPSEGPGRTGNGH